MVLESCGEIVTLDLMTRGGDGGGKLPAPLGCEVLKETFSPGAPEPKLTSVPSLPALHRSHGVWELSWSLLEELSSLPLSPVAGSGPGPQLAFSLSLQSGGTLSSLQSLQIVPHWPKDPNTGRNSPLQTFFSLLLTLPSQSHVISLLVIVGPRFSQTAAKGNSGHRCLFGILISLNFSTRPLKSLGQAVTAFPSPPTPLLSPP